jgi:hypothetical protein
MRGACVVRYIDELSRCQFILLEGFAMGDLINVSASIVDEAGGSDAAYDLIMRQASPEAFCAELLKTLQADWGLTNARGAVTLTLSITRSWRDVGEGPFASQEDAEAFRDAEVGVVARVRQTEAGWIIETLEYE